MAIDYGWMDSSHRQKVLDMAQQLADLGLSENDIAGYYQRAQTLGQRNLQDYYNQAAQRIAQQFQPQMQQARDFLGNQPLLADSGYANRLNRQLMGDLYARLSGDYGQAASNQASQNLSYLQNLTGQRIANRQAMLGQAWNTIMNPRQKQGGGTWGNIGRLAGAAVGTFIAPGAGTMAGYQMGGSLGDTASDAYYG